MPLNETAGINCLQDSQPTKALVADLPSFITSTICVLYYMHALAFLLFIQFALLKLGSQ